MPIPAELEKKFWKALKSDRTMMLGLYGMEDAHARPMTGLAEDDRSPIWFFTASDTELVEALGDGERSGRALATFASNGHDLFATLHCTLHVNTYRAVVERFEGGKDDPKLRLLRFDADKAEIWLDDSSLLAGIKMLFGADPKEDYKDKVAEVSLR